MTFLTWQFICTPFNVVYASVFEWLLHRYVMHEPFLGSTYAYKAHDKVHHETFKWDDSYHLQYKNKVQYRTDKSTIPMAWWNGPLLIFVACIFPFALSSWFSNWAIVINTAIVGGLYYLAYEGFHWVMHYPKDRWIERTALFKKMNGHHLLHHLYKKKNLNVVLPIADKIFGTYISCAKGPFAQARGPAIPDVQPK